MSTPKIISILSILILGSCIDRLNYDIELPDNLPISVEGHITNLPGPYQVKISSSFDTKSLDKPRIPISVRHINLIDEVGNNEELNEVQVGLYQTSPTGMQGRVGGVYKVRIELLDGKIYESMPDTLLPPGVIESLYHEFNSKQDAQGATQYGFDLKVNSLENDRAGRYYMWNMKSTFKALTHPESIDIYSSQCFPLLDDKFQKCNFLPLCTGLRNVAPPVSLPIFERVGPCECCICWYEIFNVSPILSDDLFQASGKYTGLNVYRIPLNGWIFMFKVHAEATQSTLTLNSFRFFKSIKEQKDAIGSLFQPITGKIPNTFIQVAGTPAPINGIFYAAGIDTASSFITREEVPNQNILSIADSNRDEGLRSCLELFPNATNIKPDFWED